MPTTRSFLVLPLLALAGAALGCDPQDIATKLGALAGKHGGGTPAGSDAGATADPGKPGDGKGPPAMGGVQCTSEQVDPKTECVTCVDASGQVVKKACNAMGGGPPPPPAPGGCEETMGKGGEKCVVCRDDTGAVTKQGCVPGGDGQGQPPPTGGVTCTSEQVDPKTTCTTCVDGSGQVIKKGCSTSGDGQPPPGDAITCAEEHVDASTVCTVCRDGNGQVVKQGGCVPANGGPK